MFGSYTISDRDPSILLLMLFELCFGIKFKSCIVAIDSFAFVTVEVV